MNDQSFPIYFQFFIVVISIAFAKSTKKRKEKVSILSLVFISILFSVYLYSYYIFGNSLYSNGIELNGDFELGLYMFGRFSFPLIIIMLIAAFPNLRRLFYVFTPLLLLSVLLPESYYDFSGILDVRLYILLPLLIPIVFNTLNYGYEYLPNEKSEDKDELTEDDILHIKRRRELADTVALFIFIIGFLVLLVLHKNNGIVILPQMDIFARVSLFLYEHPIAYLIIFLGPIIAFSSIGKKFKIKGLKFFDKLFSIIAASVFILSTMFVRVREFPEYASICDKFNIAEEEIMQNGSVIVYSGIIDNQVVVFFEFDHEIDRSLVYYQEHSDIRDEMIYVDTIKYSDNVFYFYPNEYPADSFYLSDGDYWRNWKDEINANNIHHENNVLFIEMD